MIPDKIYVWENLMYNGGYDPAWHTHTFEDSDVEYIRKDALLEWTKEKLEDLKGLLDTDPYKEVYVGQCEVYKELMNKLNSM